jgi:hypothetical protein
MTGEKAFVYLSGEACPNCGLSPGEEGHGAQMASAMTQHGRQVYLLCRSCSDRVDKGDPLNEDRIRRALAQREGAIPLPESIRG